MLFLHKCDVTLTAKKLLLQCASSIGLTQIVLTSIGLFRRNMQLNSELKFTFVLIVTFVTFCWIDFRSKANSAHHRLNIIMSIFRNSVARRQVLS